MVKSERDSQNSVPILNTYRTAVSQTLDLLCHEDFNVGRSEAVFYYTGSKISGQQRPNSSMEIIFILSGKYKIFTFVYSVSCLQELFDI